MQKKYDLIVVGGGISGVAAAVAAARDGLSVLLVEKYGCLGGAMSASLVYPFMKYFKPEATGGWRLSPVNALNDGIRFTAEENGGWRLLSDGIFTEMRRRWDAYGDTSFETYKLVFDDMVSEAGVDVLFHTSVFKADCSDRRVQKLYAATKAGVLELEADFFIDTSGDGELIAMASALRELYEKDMESCAPHTALADVFKVIQRANKYIDENAPWALAKDPEQSGRLATVLYNLLEGIRFAAVLLSAYLPVTAEKIFDQIGAAADQRDWESAAAFGGLSADVTVVKGDTLFPRIDLKKELEDKVSFIEKIEKYEMITCIVNAGFSDVVMDAAKAAGAGGGTVIHGRGTADKEAEQYFKITVQPEKDIVMLIVPARIKDRVLHL